MGDVPPSRSESLSLHAKADSGDPSVLLLNIPFLISLLQWMISLKHYENLPVCTAKKREKHSGDRVKQCIGPGSVQYVLCPPPPISLHDVLSSLDPIIPAAPTTRRQGVKHERQLANIQGNTQQTPLTNLSDRDTYRANQAAFVFHQAFLIYVPRKSEERSFQKSGTQRYL